MALHEVPAVAEGIAYLMANDPVFSRLPPYPGPVWPEFPPGFPGLVGIVLGQQVSIYAARALWDRLTARVNPLTPEATLLLSIEEMRSLGLSRQKIAYITGLAQTIQRGRLDPDSFANMNDHDIIAEITALKGFGVWSAQMYLMFVLTRPDIFTPTDLGTQDGIQAYLGLEKRPSAMEASEFGARFAPYRTAANLLLWYMTRTQLS